MSFTQDNMGDIFTENQFDLINENGFIKDDRHTFVYTFNNIEVPTDENLTSFITHFKKLYDKESYSYNTHTLWMLTGVFKRHIRCDG